MAGVNVVILCFMLFIMIQAEGDSTCKLLGNFGMPSIFKEGDIMLGGIFPLFNKEESRNVSYKSDPPAVNCIGFDLRSYRWAQVMMFAIEEINKDHSLLPNITLGYTIFYSCATATNTLRAALSLVSGREEAKSAAECHPPISAVIAEAGSTQSLAAAGMLGPFGVPVVSYFSTCACLSDRTKYRTFFRTIPSDYYQAKALASLIKHFGWSWIGVIQSDDDYGRNGVLSFTEEVKKSGACIAFTGTILRTYPRSKIRQVVETIKHSKVKVILAFSPEHDVYRLMEELVKQNITGIQWIGSEAWITGTRVSTTESFKSFGGAIGFVIRKMAIPKLRDFLVNINPFVVSQDPFVNNFWEKMVGCNPSSTKVFSTFTHIASKIMKVCTGDEKLDQTHSFFNVTQLRVSYNVYKAVYAIAYALNNLIFCTNESRNNHRKQCIDTLQIEPKQVTDYIQRVNFVDHFGEPVFFDENGDPPPSYEIINWQLRDGKVQHVTVGHFSTSIHGYELLIKEERIVWNTGKVVPKAVCSEICPTGTRKAEIKGKPICCFDCIPCAGGSIANTTGAADCIQCPQEYWSNKGKDQCIPKVIEFLSYHDPMGMGLTAVSLFGVCLAFATIVVFFNYKNTPIVKATNSELSSLLLLSLLLCFLCPLTFIGEPTVWSCMLRHTAFGITFALCISCVLGKTIVVVTAFKATLPNSNMARKFGPVQQRIIVCSCTTVQICICVLWLTLNPPFPDKNLKVSDKKIILECNTGSEAAFYAVLGYIGFLSAICLVLAFLARKLPDNFNEAKFITFSMLIFCAVWLTFIPAYVSSPGKYTVAVEIFAILSSTFGLLFCIFAPKCYIILIKPDRNTKKNVMGKPDTKRM